MAEKKEDPVEKQSFALWYFISAGLLLLGTIWSIWDEIIGRRPWKDYQKEFKKIRIKRLEDDLQKARKELETPEYKNLKQSYKQILSEYEKNPKVKETLTELKKLDNELLELRHEFNIARGEYQATVYKMEKEQDTDKKQKMMEIVKKLESQSEKTLSKIEANDRRKKELSEVLQSLSIPLEETRKKLFLYESRISDIERLISSISKEPIEIKQIVNNELNVVDRCHSCHTATALKGYDDLNHPFKSHPQVFAIQSLNKQHDILSIHNTENYGCTTCHRGQGYATTTPEKAHGNVEYWLTPMLPGKTVQASCYKCHDQQPEVQSADLLNKGRRLFIDLGCYGCHVVKGLDTDEKFRQIAPDLNEIKHKLYPGWLVDWIGNPKSFRPDTKMPRFNINKEEAVAIASYLWQNAMPRKSVEDPPYFEERVAKGKLLFENTGCYGCHRIGGKGSNFAPDLSRIGEKIRYDYLVSWLLDPGSHQPRGRMPSLRLSDEEAKNIAAYLTTLKQKPISDGQIDLNNPQQAEKGHTLISHHGCFNCHNIKGLEGKGKIGAELTAMGSKVIEQFDFGLLEKQVMKEIGLEYPRQNAGLARIAWIKKKLEDPLIFDTGKYKRPDERLRMPNYDLSKDQIDALTTFLVGLTGEYVPDTYKRKLADTENILTRGNEIIKKYNCIGCHQFTLEKIVTKDGNEFEGLTKIVEEGTVFFQLWKDNPKLDKKLGEIIDIAESDIKESLPALGGDIVLIIIQHLMESENLVQEEARAFTPPMLYGEGEKVQPDWLYGFIKNPAPLRPWLRVRMPTFRLREDELNILAHYFMLLENEPIYESVYEKDKNYVEQKKAISPDYYANARKLMDSPKINCGACHPRGDQKPQGDPSGWAPDLIYARDRLKPRWIINWLKDPQKIQAGTKMPLFPWGDFQDIFPGTAEEQTEAIKDYLMILGQEEKNILKEEEK